MPRSLGTTRSKAVQPLPPLTQVYHTISRRRARILTKTILPIDRPAARVPDKSLLRLQDHYLNHQGSVVRNSRPEFWLRYAGAFFGRPTKFYSILAFCRVFPQDMYKISSQTTGVWVTASSGTINKTIWACQIMGLLVQLRHIISAIYVSDASLTTARTTTSQITMAAVQIPPPPPKSLHFTTNLPQILPYKFHL